MSGRSSHSNGKQSTGQSSGDNNHEHPGHSEAYRTPQRGQGRQNCYDSLRDDSGNEHLDQNGSEGSQSEESSDDDEGSDGNDDSSNTQDDEEDYPDEEDSQRPMSVDEDDDHTQLQQDSDLESPIASNANEMTNSVQLASSKPLRRNQQRATSATGGDPGQQE